MSQSLNQVTYRSHWFPFETFEEDLFNDEDGLVGFNARNHLHLDLPIDYQSKYPPRGIQYTIDPYYEGVLVNLQYENGILKDILTFGDGKTGQSLLDKQDLLDNLPKEISGLQGKTEIHVMLSMSKVLIKSYQETLKELKYPAYPSDTALINAVLLGICPTEVEGTSFHLLPLDIQGNLPTGVLDHVSFRQWSKLPFQLVYLPSITEQATEFIEYLFGCIKMLKNKQKEIPYPVKGMVYKVNEFNLRDRLGSKAYHPRWALVQCFEQSLFD